MQLAETRQQRGPLQLRRGNEEVQLEEHRQIDAMRDGRRFADHPDPRQRRQHPPHPGPATVI
jgi:hypothetical protein